eukprot:TRINITY_DN6786_c0_g1_i1.p1 TRINITY_DN6786_c0_g1~~TRINITY_DN6786_c0_g1_i1.p1  ORF type:complete len:819 (-),score=191.28 TRINITY_DN6786_c0_g1_i1:405-2861(-)
MDEEALKRNTDCVYFLASPLTCKKGAECEFRHSEAARINPRDCWFWLRGNCLNVNCHFRHPPLDGLPSGVSSTSAQMSASSASSTQSTTINKTGLPCYYFNQGYCAKGEKCSFLHGPMPACPSNTWRATKASVTSTDPQSSSKQTTDDSANSESGKDTFSQNMSATLQANGNRAAQLSDALTPLSQGIVANPSCETSALKATNLGSAHPPNVVPFQPNSGNSLRSSNLGAKQSNDARVSKLLSESNPTPQVRSSQIPKVKQELEIAIPSFDTKQRGHENTWNRSRMHQSADERLQNGIDHEDMFGESSPGFDVLVDNGPEHLRHGEESAYLPRHDRELGRGLGTGQEYNMQTKSDFAYFDYDQPDHDVRDQSDHFEDPQTYEMKKHRRYDQAGWKQPNVYEDRIPERSTLLDRPLSKEDNQTWNGVKDLRHMISKRRRNSGAGAENQSKRHIDGWCADLSYNHRRHEKEGRKQDILHRDSVSRRLHGRINIDPNEYKREPFNSTDETRERRSQLRGPPGRHVSSTNFRSKYCESERTMLGDGSNLSDSRVSRGHNTRSIEMKSDTVDFAGPKSLAQIKQEKNRQNSEEATFTLNSTLGTSLKSTCTMNEDKYREDTNSKSREEACDSSEPDFAGPKPLSDILRAKRKASELCDNAEGGRDSERAPKINKKSVLDDNCKESQRGDASLLVHEKRNTHSNPSANDVENKELYSAGAPQSQKIASDPQQETVSCPISVEHVQEVKPQLQENMKTSEPEIKDNNVAMEDPVQSNEEGEYEMEQDEVEENDEWDKNGDQQEDEDYLDDDDDDAFARKLGGIFS